MGIDSGDTPKPRIDLRRLKRQLQPGLDRELGVNYPPKVRPPGPDILRDQPAPTVVEVETPTAASARAGLVGGGSESGNRTAAGAQGREPRSILPVKGGAPPDGEEQLGNLDQGVSQPDQRFPRPQDSAPTVDQGRPVAQAIGPSAESRAESPAAPTIRINFTNSKVQENASLILEQVVTQLRKQGEGSIAFDIDSEGRLGPALNLQIIRAFGDTHYTSRREGSVLIVTPDFNTSTAVGESAVRAEVVPAQTIEQNTVSDGGEQERLRQVNVTKLREMFNNPTSPMTPDLVLKGFRLQLERGGQTDEQAEVSLPDLAACAEIIVAEIGQPDGELLYLLGTEVAEGVLKKIGESSPQLRQKAEKDLQDYLVKLPQPAQAPSSPPSPPLAPPTPAAQTVRPTAAGSSPRAGDHTRPRRAPSDASANTETTHSPDEVNSLRQVGVLVHQLDETSLRDVRSLREGIVDLLWDAEITPLDPEIAGLIKSDDGQHEEVVHAFYKSIKDTAVTTDTADWIKSWKQTKDYQEWEEWDRRQGLGSKIGRIINPFGWGRSASKKEENPEQKPAERVDQQAAVEDLRAGYGRLIDRVNDVVELQDRQAFNRDIGTLVAKISNDKMSARTLNLLLGQFTEQGVRDDFKRVLNEQVYIQRESNSDWSKEVRKWLDTGTIEDAAPQSISREASSSPEVVPMQPEPEQEEDFDTEKRRIALEQATSISARIASERQLSEAEAESLMRNVQVLAREGGLERDDAVDLSESLDEALKTAPNAVAVLEDTYMDDMERAHEAKSRGEVEILLKVSDYLSLESLEYIETDLNPAMRVAYNISDE